MSESRQRLDQRRLACVLGFADPTCCTIPNGCSPCAADCTARLTVGMTRDFAEGEASPAVALNGCGTSGVLAVKERCCVDGGEAAAQPYCVGGPAGRLLDAESKQLGSASLHPFETEGLIGARRARAFTGWRRLAPSTSRSRC
jgi:hypothetical protein